MRGAERYADGSKTEIRAVAGPQGCNANAEPGRMASRRVLKCADGSTAHNSADQPLNVRKRIGSTVYEVNVYFNSDAKETMNDKTMRLIRNEVQTGKAAG